jgi:hypothetical protein
MQLEIICVLTPFLDYLHQFDPKKNLDYVGFNVWSQIQGSSYFE